jgi:hypothetical protein
MKGKIFNAQEVQAIIAGNKTQFREVVKPAAGLQSTWASVELLSKCTTNYLCEVGNRLGAQFQHPLAGTTQSYGYVDKMSPLGWFQCPYQVGQKIFVKEKFKKRRDGIYYGETPFREEYLKVSPWSLPQHMKQEHSRLTLQIKEIRVERLQSLSCADYFAETGRRPSITHADLDCETPDPKNAFKDYWNTTHRKLEGKFEANPWVWCVSFEVINN